MQHCYIKRPTSCILLSRLYNCRKIFCCFLFESNVAILYLQWDLVCDRAYLKDLTQTILNVGLMVGALICTTLSDKFGRKPIFLLSQWAMVVVGVANAFAPNYLVFTVLRFFSGTLIMVCTTAGLFFRFSSCW